MILLLIGPSYKNFKCFAHILCILILFKSFILKKAFFVLHSFNSLIF